jgi:hypothetical protein
MSEDGTQSEPFSDAGYLDLDFDARIVPYNANADFDGAMTSAFQSVRKSVKRVGAGQRGRSRGKKRLVVEQGGKRGATKKKRIIEDCSGEDEDYGMSE